MSESDATPPQGAARDAPIGGERHVSQVAGQGNPLLSKKAGMAAIAAVGGAAIGMILLTAPSKDPAGLKPQSAAGGSELAVRSTISYEAPPAPPPAPPSTAVAAPTLPPPAPPALPTQPVFAPGAAPNAAAQPQRQQRLLVYTSGNQQTAPVAPSAAPNMPADWPSSAVVMPGTSDAAGGVPAGAGGSGGPGAAVGRGDSLGARLQPTQLAGVSANVLRHQPYLITTGNVIPCVLQSAMDSSLPGLVSCVVPQDVTGKTGLTLLDRGTRVVGQFQGGITQGVERMFVTWTRAETPQGVVINLDSPASDALGRSGLSGEVDRHFWQRFGGALLLSVVDGVLQAGAAAASPEGSTSIRTGTPQAVIAETLRGSINIPPTVRKHQGELVSIFVARDLDFSTVYNVRPAPARHIVPTDRTTSGASQ